MPRQGLPRNVNFDDFGADKNYFLITGRRKKRKRTSGGGEEFCTGIGNLMIVLYMGVNALYVHYYGIKCILQAL